MKDKNTITEIKKQFLSQLQNQTLKMDNFQENNNITDKENKVIELTIPLNSWSPVKNLSKQITYKEKLASNIFDSKTSIEKQTINSYMDHNMSIEYLLASTKNNSMAVTKQKDTIIAKIKLDDNNEKLKLVAKWINEKVITSNSFIFKANEMAINNCLEGECEENSNTDIEIIYKSGDLISIDPVYEGFYPQANCQVYDNTDKAFKNINNVLEKIKQKKEQKMEQNEKLMEKLVETVEKNTNSIELLAKSIQEQGEKSTIATTQAIEKLIKTQQEAQEKKAAEDETKPQSRLQTKMEFKSVEQREQEIAAKSVEEKFVEKLIVANSNSNPNNEIRKYNEIIDVLLRSGDNVEELSNDDIKKVTSKAYNEFCEFAKRNGADPILQIKTASDWGARVLRNLDGTSPLKGLALIQNILQPGILEDWKAQFPEVQGANWIPLTGLNEVRQAIYVKSNQKISAVAEGVALEETSGITFTVILQPKRRGRVIVQNNALQVGTNLWVAQTIGTQSNIIDGLRADFYTNLFAQADKTIAELETDAKHDYNGVATIEAKIDVTPTKITWVDIDKLVTKALIMYGPSAGVNNKILMHSDTFSKLREPYLLGDKNPDFALQLNAANSWTYRGVPIIVSEIYPYKPNAAGVFAKKDRPAIIFNSEYITVYGTSIATFDDPYSGADKDQTRRIVQTRGEVKLTDPHVSTYFLEIKGS